MEQRLAWWLERLQREPDATWEEMVSGLAPPPGYERADAAEALVMILGGAAPTDPARQALDAALTRWIDPFLAWSPEQRRAFGLSRYVHWISQAAMAAGRLELPEFTRHLFEGLLHYRGILPGLYLAPQRDPLLAFYQTLAGSPTHAPRLRSFWRALCAQSGDLLPDHYLHIGLQGLRQCPPEPPNALPAWVGGLAAWLPNARDEREFVRKFRALRAMHPRAPETWRQWLAPILEASHPTIAGVSAERLRWWSKEVGGPQGTQPAKPCGGSTLRSPYPDELAKILDHFQKDRDVPALAASLKELFTRHQSFIAQTGNSYYFVRAVNETVKVLLRTPNRQTALISWRLLQRSLVFNPWNAFSWNLLGRALGALGREQSAEWTFWEAIRRDPNNTKHYAELGRLLASLGRNDEAEALFREAMRLDPLDLPSRAELGRLLASLGRNDEAEALFREAMRLDPL
ncbi:MAG: tetratricopeptide repeat protein, partial [Magnetococcales bacterium]|nr:tetratricopeptide repeat protein [Magnetococcales bacterium]